VRHGGCFLSGRDKKDAYCIKDFAMTLPVTCKSTKACHADGFNQRPRAATRPAPRPIVESSKVAEPASDSAAPAAKASATDFSGPSRLSLALPWVAVALLTSAALAFYALPDGKLGDLLRGPTLSIAGAPASGSRVVPQRPSTNPSPEAPRRQTVLTPVWETRMREETYTVKKPVVETTYREEKYTVTEPITTYAPQTVDQGQWVDQTVAQPGPEHTSLKWVKGGWTTNELGQTYWQLPGPRFAKVQSAPTYTTMRVWKPNVVTTQVPQVSYKPVTKTRQVPVESVRYVDEQRVRKVPERFCRLVEKEVDAALPVSLSRDAKSAGHGSPDDKPQMRSERGDRPSGNAPFTEI
jgi:hypothetical protein